MNNSQKKRIANNIHQPVLLMSCKRRTPIARFGTSKKNPANGITPTRKENKNHHQYSDLLERPEKSKYRWNPKVIAPTRLIIGMNPPEKNAKKAIQIYYSQLSASSNPILWRQVI
jgi:hypothetical protein